MNKYAIGDLVRVRKDLVIGEKYGGVTFAGFLAEYAGMKGRIVNVRPYRDEYVYKVDTGDDYWFGEQMLEAIEYKSVKFPQYDVSDMLNDLVALMSKYDVDTFNIEQSEGLMTFTFTKEV